MKPFSAVIILAVCTLLPLGNPVARGEDLAGPGVTIKADNLAYDKDKATYRATGNVEIVWNGYTLLSDIASLHQATNKADAEGRVKLIKGGDTLTCDRLDVNLANDQGEAYNGSIFVRQSNFHLRGTLLSKVGPEQYHLEHGVFTTCDGESPSWKFTASNLDVTLDGFATGQDAVFYLKDLPLFYFPYLMFPVKRERQSGFLFPRVGSSSQKGFALDVPYYWAISPSQDATFDVDIQTKRGVGLGVDYRYARPHYSMGEVRSYLIYDTQKEKERGNLVVQQVETLSPSLTFMSNVNLTLDRDFYRDYGEVSGDYNRQVLDSSVALAWRRQTSLLSGEFRYVDDLTAANNQGTLQRLPTVQFTTIGEKVPGTPFYVALDSNITNFSREVGQQGQRLELHPTAAYYASLPSGLDLSLRGGYLVRLYNAYGSDVARGHHGDALADSAASLSSTFVRTYDMESGSLRRLRHAFVPELAYTFTQEKDQDNLPFFDFNDRVVGGQLLSWSLTNYFTGKFLDGGDTPVYRDLAWLKLSQGYQLSGSRQDLLTLVDEGRPFTDIRIQARVTPMPLLAFTLDSRYNPYRTRFSTNNVGLDVSDGKGNLFGIGYRFSREQVEYLEGKVGVALVKPFVLNYTGRYSINKGGFLENVVNLEYRQQCWSAVLEYRQRPGTPQIPSSNELVVNFTLFGIGSIGKVRAL
jgi:LPS-assembly protein